MGGRDVGISREDCWALVEAFVKEMGLVKLHLNSYNRFIERQLQEIIDEMHRVETELPGCYVEFGRIYLGKPSVKEARGYRIDATPMDARLRNFTYEAPIYLEMSLYVDGIERNSGKVLIGHLPVMVKSKLCVLHGKSEEELIKYGESPEDPGGYFIINGSERVIVAQEDLAVNKIIVDVAPKSSGALYIAKVFSSTPAQKTPVSLELRKNGALYVTFPATPARIPFAVMMKALGVERDRDIVEMVSSNPRVQNELVISLEEAQEIRTIEEAIDYLGSRVAHGRPRERRREIAERIIDKQFLPHIGSSPEHRIEKARYLAQMARRVIEVSLGLRPIDDKDHYKNKRLKLAGDMLAVLFRYVFRQFQRDVKYQLEKLLVKRREIERININMLVRANIITDKLRHHMATGNWVGGKTGVSQLLDRTNYLATLSHLRRVVSPLSRSQPHFEARELHSTQWGRICPIETPEGPNCGLVKNLSLMAVVTTGEDFESVKRMLYTVFNVRPVEEAQPNWADVYVNDILIGKHPRPKELVKTIRMYRRKGEISPEINVAYVEGGFGVEVRVNADANRIVRPLIVVENGKPKLTKEHVEKLRSGKLTWSDLLRMGVIEYLDAEEEENAYIAVWPEEVRKEHTHLEIAPAALFGVVASVIPFANHNHSPRNTFEAAMGKQALGIPLTNFMVRVDTRGHFLHYPQRPLVDTKPMRIIGLDKVPFGQNMVVAVLSYTGYNIQDAVILNKSAVDRGLARSTFFRLYEAEERRYPGGTKDEIKIPEPTVKNYRVSESYAKLEPDGIVPPEIEVYGNEVLIGRTSPPRFMEEYGEFRRLSRRDTSVALRHGEKGIVDRVILTMTVEGNPLIKVKVRDLRIPEIGDKFASRHGQKGVVGILLPQEDMPFTEDGIVPDLIINPHAMPSRMTIGQLLESITGKLAALKGEIEDGTPFEENVEERVRRELMAYGFEPRGKEVLYNGFTGERLEAEIFVGIVYYQKLHHMVSDKIHARARGPVQILTKQPTEGRAREGGLRFGEMERDCLIGHGAVASLKDRLMDMSDRTLIYVCKKCGMLSYYDHRRETYVCPLCGPDADVAEVEVSYAFKLLLQELMSMMIYPKIEVVERYRRLR